MKDMIFWLFVIAFCAVTWGLTELICWLMDKPGCDKLEES